MYVKGSGGSICESKRFSKISKNSNNLVNKRTTTYRPIKTIFKQLTITVETVLIRKVIFKI